MTSPIHITQSIYICSFLASHTVPGPSLLSLGGAPRGLLEDQNRGKGSTHRLKHLVLMPEHDLLCNNCPSSGGTCAVLPSKAPCARQKGTTGVPASDASLCPSQVLLAGSQSQPGLEPSTSHPLSTSTALDQGVSTFGGLGKPQCLPLLQGCAAHQEQQSPALFIPE